MKRLIFPLIILCLLPFDVFAWSLLGPNNANDCILYYQKKAKTQSSAFVINWACKCKFDEVYILNQENICPKYSKKTIDCILKNVPDAQTENSAKSIVGACKNQE